MLIARAIVERMRRWRQPRDAVWLPVLPPLGAFAELAVLAGLIQLAAVLMPGLDVLNLEPNPYWLPILLLSLQYGTVAGLMAAGAGIVAYALSSLPEQMIDEHHFAYLLRAWSLPILWIGVALVLGQFRMRQIAQKQSLKLALNQRTREAQALTAYTRELEQRCQHLERHLTTAIGRDGSAVLDAIASVQGANADVTRALALLGSASFPGSKLSLYTLHANAFEPVADAGSARQARIPADHPMFLAVAGEKRALSVLNQHEEADLAGEGLAAVPILHPDTGRVLGMLKLDAAGADVLSDGVGARMAVVARILAPALAEPRVVVDNTGRAGEVNRLTKGWRHFGWQQHDEGEASPSAGPDKPRGTRPRLLK